MSKYRRKVQPETCPARQRRGLPPPPCSQGDRVDEATQRDQNKLLSEYPNIPAWLTRSKVYLAWLAITGIGTAGLLFLRSRLQLLGLLLIGVYAALGFAGLDHYSLAPIRAHTATMNATIWSEVVAAACLLAATAALVLAHCRRSLSPQD